nr:carboxyl transferase domain-containing protein [Angustibacter aerolatus]
MRERIALLFDDGAFVEDGRYANALADRLPADGVVTGRGTVDGRPAMVVANDPTVKAGSWGARTVEKIVRATEHALREEPAGLLVRRLGRCPDHRPGRPVPRAPRRRADLPQPGRAVGSGAADLLPVRPLGGRRRVHPGVHRLRDHGGGQRVDVPRQPADGRDGRRREGVARGDGRRPHALHRQRLRRPARERRRRRHRAGSAAAVVPALDLARRAADLRARAAADAARRERGARGREPAVRRPRGARRAAGRGLVLRGEAAVRGRAWSPASGGWTAARSAWSPTTAR